MGSVEGKLGVVRMIMEFRPSSPTSALGNVDSAAAVGRICSPEDDGTSLL